LLYIYTVNESDVTADLIFIDAEPRAEWRNQHHDPHCLPPSNRKINMWEKKRFLSSELKRCDFKLPTVSL